LKVTISSVLALPKMYHAEVAIAFMFLNNADSIFECHIYAFKKQTCSVVVNMSLQRKICCCSCFCDWS